jgi:molybdenum cofactor synthesis domain-containing protein
MKAYVITVGNEILKGRTINTNAAHIGRVLTYAGYDVIRMVVVPDDIDEIVWAFRDGISRADLVVSTGGLGPTFDDKTVEGLAKALNLELELNQEAYSMVKGKYDRLGVELTRERVKMAYMPRGARPLPNPVGTAPGVYLEYGGKRIIALPGVPAEMEAILDEVLPQIRVPGRYYYEESVTIRGIMESTFAPIVSELMRANAGSVYIKSHPRGIEISKPTLEIEVSASGSSEDGVKARVKEVIRRIMEEARRINNECC